MPQRNESHNYPSRRSSLHTHQSARVPSSQRINVPNARDELERERELYSAHDPRHGAPSPAQRYAQAHNQQTDNRHYSWEQQPKNVGYNSSSTHNSYSEFQASQRHKPSYTSHTPYVGEATLSGRIQKQSASNGNAKPHQTNPFNASAVSHQNTSGANRTFPHQTASTAAHQNAAQKPHAHTGGYEKTTQSTTPSARATHSSDFNAERYLSVQRSRRKAPGSVRIALISGALGLVVIAAGIFGFTTWDANRPVNATINGEQQTISGEQRTIDGLLNTNTVSVTPGNFVAVDESVMRQGEGTRANASINGETKEDFSIRINEGDDVSITNGTDITEDYTQGEPQILQPTLEIQGEGAVHSYIQKGEAGEKVVRTGVESGKTAEVTTKEPVNGVLQYYNVNSNGEKVIALTFDDGPWDSSTASILDILKENDAKATFFTVGNMITGHEDLVKRASEEGQEIATHTWDHAEGSGQGVSLILMSSDERKAEVEKGMQAIKDATGKDASLMFRSPGGNFDAAVASDLWGMIDAEIGWNVDTEDWRRPGADAITQRIESVRPGEIVLMHDGGGDRSQTVAALKQALPKLKEQGYRFVTVGELLSTYPYQG